MTTTFWMTLSLFSNQYKHGEVKVFRVRTLRDVPSEEGLHSQLCEGRTLGDRHSQYHVGILKAKILIISL